MTMHKKLSIFGIILALLGLIIAAPFAYSFAIHQLTDAGEPTTGKNIALPQQKPATKKPVKIEGTPIRLQIPSLGIDLGVAKGYYDKTTTKWTLDKVNAFFAAPSVKPNNRGGNTLIYGHNIAPVFARLQNIPDKAKVILYTDNGHRLVYTYKSSEVVDPNNTSIFDYEGKPRLTLQTCTGAWFENRQFYYFELVKAR